MTVKLFKNNINEEFKILKHFISLSNNSICSSKTNFDYLSTEMEITKIIMCHTYQISDIYSFINQNLNSVERIEGNEIFSKINLNNNNKSNLIYEFK